MAQVAVAQATSLSNSLARLLDAKARAIDAYEPLVLFAFMNFTFAQGAWSNLTNQRLRRDLQISLKDALILRLAREFPGNTSDKAAKAIRLEDQFNSYLRAYVAGAKNIGESDSRFATLFALGILKEKLGLGDADMDEIVPRLISVAGVSKETEDMANEVLNAFSKQKVGFWGRLFGGS
jgi:hypothetical protein